MEHSVIAEDIARAIEEISPLDSGVPQDQLGFLYGDPQTPVIGAACTWTAHPRSVRRCIEAGANLIVCHESLWYSPQDSPWYQGPSAGDIHANRVLRGLLEDNNLVVYRSHSNWDGLVRDGIHDQAVGALEIKGLRETARQKFFAVQTLPAPMTVAALKEIVQARWAFPACRLFGDPDKTITRFSVLIGGFGENQTHMPQAAAQMGAEALIIGEMSEFILIAALEMGLPVIESLHSISETPGIKRQAARLAQCFPNIPVHFIPSGAQTFSAFS